ncbi:MAG TPA: hypothetical protein VE011_11325, partial [Candidatus Dormibacteraeota bacterium]|nr:hypothetical protein [Candidatus Dormibacteraeota bacterium]
MPQQLADVHDLGLDLDDQERPSGGMPPENVDEAPLAGGAEGDLCARRPPELAQGSNDRLDQASVFARCEVMKVAVPRPWSEIKPHLEGARHGPDRTQAQRLEVTALHARDGHVRDTRHAGNINLTEPASNAHRAEDRADAVVEHDRMLATGAYPAVTRGGAGASKIEHAFDMMADRAGAVDGQATAWGQPKSG